MFVKVFAQILDSSIAEDYLVRFVFEDLLKLADKEGLVDMTPGAISRRTHVPLEIVNRGIEKLLLPDPESRSPAEEGRRIVPIDAHRSWGWRIVNYLDYRNIRDEEARRTYFRERKREQRAASRNVQDSQRPSNTVHTGPVVSTKAEAEADLKNIPAKKKPSPESLTLYGIYPRKIGKADALKSIDRVLLNRPFQEMLLAVQEFARKCSREGTEERFIPHPATWFNKGRYDDEEFKPKHDALAGMKFFEPKGVQ
jgi:hypothetical protein